MAKKIMTADEAVAGVQDGMTIMVGGFLGTGSPEVLMDALVRKGVKHLTVIGNDGGLAPGQPAGEFGAKTARGIGKLLENHMVDHIIASHIGVNPMINEQVAEGTLRYTLVPQGTLAEKIRAAAYGLGGVLTPTGVGTDVANGKQVINVDGKEYLLETALKGDVCLIKGSIVDKLGNVYYKGTTKNFCPLMAAACKTVIVEAEKVVEPGEIEPEDVMTPFVLVDYIVEGGKN